MNAKSECPDRYKTSVVRAFIRRAHTHCSSYALLHSELSRMKQVLVNNGYSNSEIDEEIKTYMEKERNVAPKKKENTIRLYYRSFMSSAYKVDERVIRGIIFDNVTCTNKNDTLDLTIYYTTKKTSSLIMKNNITASKDTLKMTNVVYKFCCPIEDCRLHSVGYIGATTTSLSRRLTMHLQEGTLKEHMTEQHGIPLTRKHLTQNTTVLKTCSNRTQLMITEALYIREHTPALNKQLHSQNILTLWNTALTN